MKGIRLAPALCLAALTSCRSTLEYRQNAGWNAAAVYTTADTRMIIQRPHPLGGTGRTVVCTEPSPDVAKALSTASDLQLSGGNGAANATLGGGLASAEAAAELAGRSTALLGLRDGLYRTCEAYANGALGDQAYALVLSRYGQLMATLFLGQDVLEAGIPARVSSPDLPSALPASQPGTTTPPVQPGPTTPKPTVSGAATPPSAAPGAAPSVAASGAPDWPALLRDAVWLPTAPDAGAAAAAPAPGVLLGGLPSASSRPPVGAGVPQAAPLRAGPPKAVLPQVVQAARNNGASSGTGAADALARMQAAYLDLDNPPRLLNVLLVACLNAEDPTRPAQAWALAAGGSAEGATLSALCRQLPTTLLTSQASAQARRPARSR